MDYILGEACLSCPLLLTLTSNPSFKNHKSLFQKTRFLKHSISIYAYTYIDESHPMRSLSFLPAPFNLDLKSLIQKPQIPLSKNTIPKALHKYIRIYLYSIVAIVKLKTKNLS